MFSSLFFIPYEAVSAARLLRHLSRVLSELDLVPPDLVMVSKPELAARDGAWTLAFGRRVGSTPSTRAHREIARRYFVEALRNGGEFAVGFTGVGVDLPHQMAVFEWRAPRPESRSQSMYLVSYERELAGDLAALRGGLPRDGSLNAVALGVRHVGLRASAATMEGARCFEFRHNTLTPVQQQPFDNLIYPGIDPDADLWPTGKTFEPPLVLIPHASPATKLERDAAVEIENGVGAATASGTELARALTQVRHVLASFPSSTRALTLHATLLEQLGDKREYELALRHALAEGLASHHRTKGAARLQTIGEPADRLANFLFTEDRDAEAVEVLDLAIATQHPVHSVQLQRRRSLLAAGLRGRNKTKPAPRRSVTPTPFIIAFTLLFFAAIWKLTLM